MAKNIFQAKKRVSHFQKTHKDLDGENELFGCKDYVSSIIQDMDSNFSYIQSGCSKKGIEANETHLTPSEDSFLSIPVLKIPSPPSTNGTLQIPVKHTNPKKFTFSKKFPLMEKSQKILKQLKHNQNIPKPRAHLAGFPKSPSKSKAKYISPKISVAKKKEIQNVKNKVISSPHCKVPSNHSPVLNIKNSNLSKISKDGLAAKRSKPKKVEDTSGKGSFDDIPTNIDSSKETNSILESDSGTSDSEYERFVKKSKKGLQKKSSKRQKQNTRKDKSCKRSLKRKKLSCVSEQKNTYNRDNVTESSKNSKISPFKKQKILHNDNTHFENDFTCFDDDVPTRDSSSESDDDGVATSKTQQGISKACEVKPVSDDTHFENDFTCFDDVPTRDSSSESDDDGVATSKTSQVISKACEVKPVSETIVLSNSNSSRSYSNFSVSESNNNSDLLSSNNETQIANSVKLEVQHAGKTTKNSLANLHEPHQNLHVLESNIKSEVQDKFENENLLNSIKIERDILPSNLVIDICDSDDECNSGELNVSEFSSSKNMLPTSINNSTKSSADSDSEESDVEIIEEVEKPVQTMDKCSAPVLTNAPDCLKNAVRRENICVDVKPSIKTKDLDNKSLVNILPVVKHQSVAEIGDKQDVVYRTDICHTKMILEQRTIISSHCSKSQNVPSKGSLQANPDLTVVKQEIGSDDDIIILDSIHSTKAVDNLNLPSAKNENIKSEPSTSENKLKLLDTIDFEANDWEKKFKDVIPVSSTELLEWYKMEFETYMEMKQANADVEASLKNLQARQAQKMLYVRTLLHKCVKGNQDPKTLAGSAPLPLTEPSKDSKDIISANVQNNCDTPNNSFSLNPQIVLPSSVVQDIKPDVNKLKEGILSVAIKPKIESIQDDLNSRKILSPKVESDDKQPLKLLLDEKCSVCGKDAVAACQRCAKVFFCSHECGRKFWIDGHVKVCGTK